MNESGLPKLHLVGNLEETHLVLPQDSWDEFIQLHTSDVLTKAIEFPMAKGEHGLLHLLRPLLVLKPALRPKDVRVHSEDFFSAMQHWCVDTDIGTAGYEHAADGEPSRWDNAFVRHALDDVAAH